MQLSADQRNNLAKLHGDLRLTGLLSQLVTLQGDGERTETKWSVSGEPESERMGV